MRKPRSGVRSEAPLTVTVSYKIIFLSDTNQYLKKHKIFNITNFDIPRYELFANLFVFLPFSFHTISLVLRHPALFLLYNVTVNLQ